MSTLQVDYVKPTGLEPPTLRKLRCVIRATHSSTESTEAHGFAEAVIQLATRRATVKPSKEAKEIANAEEEMQFNQVNKKGVSARDARLQGISIWIKIKV